MPVFLGLMNLRTRGRLHTALCPAPECRVQSRHQFVSLSSNCSAVLTSKSSGRIPTAWMTRWRIVPACRNGLPSNGITTSRSMSEAVSWFPIRPGPEEDDFVRLKLSCNDCTEACDLPAPLPRSGVARFRCPDFCGLAFHSSKYSSYPAHGDNATSDAAQGAQKSLSQNWRMESLQITLRTAPASAVPHVVLAK